MLVVLILLFLKKLKQYPSAFTMLGNINRKDCIES